MSTTYNLQHIDGSTTTELRPLLGLNSTKWQPRSFLLKQFQQYEGPLHFYFLRSCDRCTSCDVNIRKFRCHPGVRWTAEHFVISFACWLVIYLLIKIWHWTAKNMLFGKFKPLLLLLYCWGSFISRNSSWWWFIQSCAHIISLCDSSSVKRMTTSGFLSLAHRGAGTVNTWLLCWTEFHSKHTIKWKLERWIVPYTKICANDLKFRDIPPSNSIAVARKHSAIIPVVNLRARF